MVFAFWLSLTLIASVPAATGALPEVAASSAPGKPANAAASKPPASDAAPSTLTPYEKFTQGATAQRGLFTIWRKEGDVSIELRPDQFDKDFIELGVPVNGIGGGLFSGITDLQNCRIVRFEREDNRVAVLFPTTRFLAQPGSPEQLAVEAGTANSVAGVAKVLSVDEKTHDVVFDAAPFLQDLTDVADFLSSLNGALPPQTTNPTGAYHLSEQSTYFGATKAFPDNVVIVANQTFSTLNPQFIDTPADARNLQIQLQYDIAALPADDGYIPRYYDDRVGYFVNAHDDFSSDDSFNKDANYIVRWNIAPSDPSEPLSPAKKPIVYYLSNTIPLRYRAPIRKALLTWNKAFVPLGISNVVEVEDQPNDPNFDPDDIRYNVVRWLTEEQGSFAEAQLLYNPYTGEMIKSGIVVDSDLMRFGKFQYPALVDSQGHAAVSQELGANFVQGERQQLGYGMTVLSIMNGMNGYQIPQKFADEFLESIVLHESGHDFGLRHNFIGSEAYTAKQLQSPSFTQHYGVASSVMEYSPINIWAKGTPHGEYFQTVLGPYDYFAIHWGYAPVAGAKTPADELPVLNRWAAQWAEPYRAFLSDEDVNWSAGAAIDPRNQQWDLTNDNISWCTAQMSLAHQLIARVDRRFPRAEGSYDDLRQAFGFLASQAGSCGAIVSRYIGGEYVSRTRRGDPHRALPLSAIPKRTQLRAFRVLQSEIFSSKAWDFSPHLLRQLVTQYRYDDWNGNLPPRHDVAVEEYAARYQSAVISRLFTPVTLQRLDDMQFKYPKGQTMEIADLFLWMQSAVYADVARPRNGDIPLVRRNLQRNYASQLSRLANAPAPGTPADAQALARYELGRLHANLVVSMRRNQLDLLTRAHLASLDTDVERALHAQAVIPAVRSI